MRHYEDVEAIYQRPAQVGGVSVLGIDPGPSESAYALVRSDYTVALAEKTDNAELLDVVFPLLCAKGKQTRMRVAIESLQSYGMPVGRSVFGTAYMIGKLLRECERVGISSALYCRQEYARAMCGTAKISDAILRQALELRFGGYRKGEPLAFLRGSTDKRSAFAVAAYFLDVQRASSCRDLPVTHIPHTPVRKSAKRKRSNAYGGWVVS